MNLPSIAVLQKCAKGHLDNFTNPTGDRSFHSYDRRGDVSKFEPLDALAPELLDAGIRRWQVNRMWSGNETDPFNLLRVAIEECLCEISRISGDELDRLRFVDTDLGDENGPWALVRKCLRASELTRGIKASKVSKMLHRKWPNFIPIIDSKLTEFYGLPNRQPWKYWPILQQDHRANLDWLEKLAKGRKTADGFQIAPLRVHDIVIWEHYESGCPAVCREVQQ